MKDVELIWTDHEARDMEKVLHFPFYIVNANPVHCARLGTATHMDEQVNVIGYDKTKLRILRVGSLGNPGMPINAKYMPTDENAFYCWPLFCTKCRTVQPYSTTLVCTDAPCCQWCSHPVARCGQALQALKRLVDWRSAWKLLSDELRYIRLFNSFERRIGDDW